jgi:hypothetical protein
MLMQDSKHSIECTKYTNIQRIRQKMKLKKKMKKKFKFQKRNILEMWL